jgi:hypothetical protein
MRELWSPIPQAMQQHGGRSKSAASQRDPAKEERKASATKSPSDTVSNDKRLTVKRGRKSSRIHSPA